MSNPPRRDLGSPWRGTNAGPPTGRPPAQFRPFGVTYGMSVLKPGMVIRGPVHNPNVPEAPPGDPDTLDQSLTLTYIGRWARSKMRTQIIVEKYARHYITIPVFTHNGDGLGGKSYREEYIGVRDSEDRPPLNSESPHGNVIVTRIAPFLDAPRGSPYFVHSRAYAWLRHPVIFHNMTQCEIIGNISDGDLTRILDIMYKRPYPEPQIVKDVYDLQSYKIPDPRFYDGEQDKNPRLLVLIRAPEVDQRRDAARRARLANAVAAQNLGPQR